MAFVYSHVGLGENEAADKAAEMAILRMEMKEMQILPSDAAMLELSFLHLVASRMPDELRETFRGRTKGDYSPL